MKENNDWLVELLEQNIHYLQQEDSNLSEIVNKTKQAIRAEIASRLLSVKELTKIVRETSHKSCERFVDCGNDYFAKVEFKEIAKVVHKQVKEKLL
ncbi:MAG: hypothetical protein DRP08_08050 [Candidatus Aenigmatarchaeota archaeon]|nr:MAG: hypothetical protein DRP08_08050 [Candidatus Aenigmarchaeota archaeon]